MDTKFNCSACGKPILAPEEYAGRVISCPNTSCGREITVPRCSDTNLTPVAPSTDITFNCPHCNHALVIDQKGAGKKFACSECGRTIVVPTPEETTPPAALLLPTAAARSPTTPTPRVLVPSQRPPNAVGVPPAVATVRHGQLVSDKEFRESVGSVIKGLIVIVALSILQSVTCSLLNISTEFWGINLSGWIRIVISTIILGVVVGRYKPLKTIVTFYLIAFVKVGKMPGREKYLEDLIALAGSITLLVFIISIYGYAQPIVSMLNAELIQFGPLNMIINIVVILIVVGILLAVWKRVHPLIDDLTGHITDKVSTLSSFIAYSTCPRCNAKNDHDAAFCIACGAGMQSAEPVVSGGGTCPQCACTNSPESKFCQKCGSPL